MYTIASIPRDVVAYGSRVTLLDEDADADEPIAYEIVFPEEVDAGTRPDLPVVADRPGAREQDGGRRGRGADAGGRRTYQIVELVTFHERASGARADGRLTSARRRAGAGRRPRGPPGFEKIPVAHSMPSSWPRCGHDLPVPVELRPVAAVERARVEGDAVGRDRRRPVPSRASASTSSSASGSSASSVDGAEVGLVRRPALIQVSYGYAEANGVKLTKSPRCATTRSPACAASRPADRRRRSAPCGGSTRGRRRAPPRGASA